MPAKVVIIIETVKYLGIRFEKIKKRVLSHPLGLGLHEGGFVAVGGGADGEVEPVGAAGTALDEEFVEVGLEGALGNLSAFKLTPSCVGEVEEDGGVADGLFEAEAADVDGAACGVVARGRAACLAVHFGRAVA